MGQQPEYATGDVLLASCYRVLGLAAASESNVDLENIHRLPSLLETEAIPATAWEFIFKGALRSPRRRGERTTRPLPQVVPLVPALGNFSGVLGRPRSRWNPGMLALYTLASGTSPEFFEEAVSKFVRALDAVQDYDDEFAWFLENSLKSLPESQRTGGNSTWLEKIDLPRIAFRDQQRDPWSPAEIFVRDLEKLIQLKPSLTRRQWCALVESLLRIGLASHVLWIGSLNSFVWECSLEVLGGGAPPSRHEIEASLWSSHARNEPYLEGGQSALPYLRRQIESYSMARLGINLLFHALEERGNPLVWPEEVSTSGLPADAQVAHFLEHLGRVRNDLGPDPRGWIASELGSTIDDLAANRGITLSGRSGGVPKNLHEFLAYTLQRRQAEEVVLKEHDQGYLLAKASSARSAPWVVRPGPVLLLAMSHVTHASMPGAPVTLRHLANHFGYYGVRLATGDLQEGDIATDLATLGILVDSPDAGGGRLVLDPFEKVVNSG